MKQIAINFIEAFTIKVKDVTKIYKKMYGLSGTLPSVWKRMFNLLRALEALMMSPLQYVQYIDDMRKGFIE